MNPTSSPLLALLAASLAACGAASAGTPPAETSPAPAAASAPAADTARRRHTAADARFMTHMIHHHSQARVMAALVPERTARPEIRLIAERIDVSQEDEMRQMRSWLRNRGEAVPDTGAMMHGGEHMMMPGMLTGAELARLAASRGAEFDRLFLEFMIRHHEGAVAMVAELLATPGAAQESDTYRFASDVNADQRAEIARMRTLLNTVVPRG